MILRRYITYNTEYKIIFKFHQTPPILFYQLMLSLTGNNASDIYDVCQYILQRIILYESSGKDEKAGVGGKISECGKHRQIPPHHSAFLFKV